MTKFFGRIGFGETVETSPGIWENVITDREYYGDIVRNTHRWDSSQSVNDNITISNQISILADPYAFEHLSSIKYVEFAGALWKVSSVDIQSPRLLITIGGVYNEVEN